MREVDELDAWYGQAQALWGVCLTVGAGEVVCVVGPNGAGKTTLVHAIGGLHRQLRGHIRVGGADLARVPPHRVSGHGVSVVPEGRRVFAHLSVHENLCVGAYRMGARAAHRDTLAEVHELFPRLRERARQPAGSLSGGEQQMLAIGRALMAQPRLLLLDEPSLGLAPLVVDEVFDAIGAINRRGVSILLVEQDVERALDLADRAYLLSEGRVVTTGTSAELRASDTIRRSVLGH
jgi:branched-chain amino acid transport system ATP-binding protein